MEEYAGIANRELEGKKHAVDALESSGHHTFVESRNHPMLDSLGTRPIASIRWVWVPFGFQTGSILFIAGVPLVKRLFSAVTSTAQWHCALRESAMQLQVRAT
jgi:hypothetical protein